MRFWIKLSVSIVCLGWVFLVTPWSEVLECLQGVHMPVFLGAVGVFVLAVIVWCWNWIFLARAYGVKEGVLSMLSLSFLGAFVNNMVPGALFGDRLRGYALGARSGDIVRSWAATMLERFISVISIFAVTLILLAIGGRGLAKCAVQLPFILFLIMIIAVPAAFFVFLSEVKAWLGRDWFTEIILSSVILPKRKQNFFKSLFFGPLMIAVEGTAILLVSQSLGLEAPYMIYYIFAGMLHLLRVFPVCYSLFGLQDLIFVLLLPLTGMSAPEAFALSIMVHIARVISTFPGIFFMKVLNEKLGPVPEGVKE